MANSNYIVAILIACQDPFLGLVALWDVPWLVLCWNKSTLSRAWRDLSSSIVRRSSSCFQVPEANGNQWQPMATNGNQWQPMATSLRSIILPIAKPCKATKHIIKTFFFFDCKLEEFQYFKLCPSVSQIRATDYGSIEISGAHSLPRNDNDKLW